MITELKITNFKSIVNETISLSNVNVFIGENGCGKTNILEALAFLSAAKKSDVNINELSNKGVRVTKPILTMSSFIGAKQKNEIGIEAKYSDKNLFDKCTIYPKDKDDIFSEWIVNGNFIEKALDKAIDFYLTKSKNEKEIHSLLEREIRQETKEKLNQELTTEKKSDLSRYLIYNINTQSLRGVINSSKETPLGINGEGLDVLLNDFSKDEWNKLKEYSYLISWLDDYVIDKADAMKFSGHKLGRSSSILYFKDKYMKKNNNVFAAENSNEGVLHILFYLVLLISKKTPGLFAIDNIESSLNPKMCRTIMKIIAQLAVEQNKQVLITTHNPSILDGINLFNDSQRLFIVKREDNGFTKVDQLKVKENVEGRELKLSEMWMRGYIGGIPNNF